MLKCIECAMPHKCAKTVNGSASCTKCDSEYRFIVFEPITLKCGHHICKECKKKAENENANCKICNENIKITDGIGAASDLFIKMYLKDLTSELNNKYSKTLSHFNGNAWVLSLFFQFYINCIFSESQKDAEDKVSKLKQAVRNEIDKRVEKLKHEIDVARGELFKDVDRACNDSLKYF